MGLGGRGKCCGKYIKVNKKEKKFEEEEKDWHERTLENIKKV